MSVVKVNAAFKIFIYNHVSWLGVAILAYSFEYVAWI